MEIGGFDCYEMKFRRQWKMFTWDWVCAYNSLDIPYVTETRMVESSGSTSAPLCCQINDGEEWHFYQQWKEWHFSSKCFVRRIGAVNIKSKGNMSVLLPFCNVLDMFYFFQTKLLCSLTSSVSWRMIWRLCGGGYRIAGWRRIGFYILNAVADGKLLSIACSSSNNLIVMCLHS